GRGRLLDSLERGHQEPNPCGRDIADCLDQNRHCWRSILNLLNLQSTQEVQGSLLKSVANNHFTVRARIGVDGTLLQFTGNIQEILDGLEFQFLTYLASRGCVLVVHVELQCGRPKFVAPDPLADCYEEPPLASLIHRRMKARSELLGRALEFSC